MLLHRFLVGVLLAGGMGYGGYRKKSLSVSGGIAAFIVGLLTTIAGIRYSLTVIIFFISSSILTRLGTKKKQALEEDHKKGGQRTAVQVLCNSLPGLVACFLAQYFEVGGIDCERLDLSFSGVSLSSIFAVAFLGHYAACTGDTWASEVGILSKSSPRLVIQPWRTVPAGTNGGVTLLGTAACMSGGLFIGAVFYLLRPVVDQLGFDDQGLLACVPVQANQPQWPVVVLGLFAGFTGSFVDSFLGATVQYSGYCSERKMVVNQPGPTVKRICGYNILDNHLVNLLSAFIVSALTPLFALWLFAPSTSITC